MGFKGITDEQIKKGLEKEVGVARPGAKDYLLDALGFGGALLGIPAMMSAPKLPKLSKPGKLDEFIDRYNKMKAETDMLGETFWDEAYTGDRKNILNLYNNMRDKFTSLKNEMKRHGLQYPPKGADPTPFNADVYSTGSVVETIQKKKVK